MSSARTRRLVLGGLIVALAAWLIVPRLAGLPAAARAGSAGLTATAGLPELDPAVTTPPGLARPSGSALTAGRRESPETAARPWPADPFFHLPAEPNSGTPATAATAATAAGMAAVRAPTFHLSAIIAGPEPRALLNGNIVVLGATVADGTTIVAIAADSVTLAGPQGPIVLRLVE
ncbi:MAG: hypothetical protein AB1716_09675 [Planctomycetota bacterium]